MPWAASDVCLQLSRTGNFCLSHGLGLGGPGPDLGGEGAPLAYMPQGPLGWSSSSPSLSLLLCLSLSYLSAFSSDAGVDSVSSSDGGWTAVMVLRFLRLPELLGTSGGSFIGVIAPLWIYGG